MNQSVSSFTKRLDKQIYNGIHVDCLKYNKSWQIVEKNMKIGNIIPKRSNIQEGKHWHKTQTKFDVRDSFERHRWFHAADNFNFLARVAGRMFIESDLGLGLLWIAGSTMEFLCVYNISNISIKFCVRHILPFYKMQCLLPQSTYIMTIHCIYMYIYSIIFICNYRIL